MAIRIVTDSSADLPPELVQERNITVVPCYVLVDDASRRDGVDITAEEFYKKLADGGRLPSTSQPTTADFQTIYQEHLERGDDVVSIHVSGKLSGTINSAQQAKAALGNPEGIQIVDSLLASIPLGLAALEAATIAQDGSTAVQVAEQVRQGLGRHSCYFLVDTLEYLQKGGRIGKASAFLGSILSVKPILTIVDGEAHPVERPRSRAKGLSRLQVLVRELGPVERLAVAHSTTPEEAQELGRNLEGMVPAQEIMFTRFGATLGTYLGPGALGVGVTRKS